MELVKIGPKMIAALASAALLAACATTSQDTRERRFDLVSDLLVAHYDIRTDVDDLHAIAAMGSILRHPDYAGLRFHATVGTVGTQEGRFIDVPALYPAAFGERWGHAIARPDEALAAEVSAIREAIAAGGDVWIAEGGQSDFTARVLAALGEDAPAGRIHVVQHADWNEEVTTPSALAAVRQRSDYHKIPDGNAGGNGTAQLRTPSPAIAARFAAGAGTFDIWSLALAAASAENGRDAYDNSAIGAGGLDFSDTVEVLYILEEDGISDASDFADRFLDPPGSSR